MPYHVLGMFCQYWHLSIHTAWSNTRPCQPSLSAALYVLHVRVLVTRGSRDQWQSGATEVPVTVPLHAWSGQGQPPVTGPSLVTTSSQLVREPIIATRSPPIASMAKKAGGRTIRTHAHMATFEKLETRVYLGFKFFLSA